MATAGQISARAGEAASAGSSRLKQAVHRHKALSRDGLQERLFTFVFSGLVYPQIWEDPVVDLDALRLRDGERLVAIASGGCNVLSYLTAADVAITAVDLNPAHVALNRLKLAGLEHLPDHAAFRRFFGEARSPANLDDYRRWLEPRLDAATRAYWDGRDLAGRRRIGYFATNLYRHGLLGLFIGTGHAVARLHGRNPRRMLEARSQAEQAAIFADELAPLFRMPHIRWLLGRPSSLFGLGIPPSQFEALKGEHHMADVVLARLQQLACGFDITENYFAQQAFGRAYAGEGSVPPYLERRHYDMLRSRSGRLDIRHASLTEYLAAEAPASHDAYVLLDAQDWMTDEQLVALWTQIDRTARPGARVIFRTAGEPSILPGRVPDSILGRFTYDPAACRDWTRRDRSSIYGGFHLYVARPEVSR
jgi:S-adenosylmethionine-diacylglycerol 3-amino-3-carboxypropyl transferase